MNNISGFHYSFLACIGKKSVINFFPSCFIFILILLGYFSIAGVIMIGLGGTIVSQSSQQLIKKT